MEECLDGPIVDVPAHNDELATVHRVLTRIPAHHKLVIKTVLIFLKNQLKLHRNCGLGSRLKKANFTDLGEPKIHIFVQADQSPF